MSTKIAVAIVHGICVGNEFDNEESPKYTDGMAQALKLKLADIAGKSGSEDQKLKWIDSKLAITAINWTPVLREERKNLYQKLGVDNLDSFFGLREFIFQAIADSLTYQVTQSKIDNLWSYAGIHRCFADGLNSLAQEEQAGSDAPLCIISHSLGTVISSNYIYDLQTKKAQIDIGDTPLERGETLTSVYTMASQIPFWSLRHPNFNQPIKVPSEKLGQYYPNLKGEWINFYNKSDIMAYPLKSLNEAYSKAVTEDQEVNNGGLLESWNPLSHCSYWTSERAIDTIANGLYDILQQLDP
ncbi:MAG TPA: hypothetical protein V6C71_11670 [Coleofasciculaceae cyanobacterium]|jgi:hypothetical protein